MIEPSSRAARDAQLGSGELGCDDRVGGLGIELAFEVPVEVLHNDADRLFVAGGTGEGRFDFLVELLERNLLRKVFRNDFELADFLIDRAAGRFEDGFGLVDFLAIARDALDDIGIGDSAIAIVLRDALHLRDEQRQNEEVVLVAGTACSRDVAFEAREKRVRHSIFFLLEIFLLHINH